MAANIQPNQYILRGDKTRIAYATTSFSGRATLACTISRKEMTFTGSDIRSIDTEVGELVTVTVDDGTDSGTPTITLLIPRVSLRRPDDKVEIETLAIFVKPRGREPEQQQQQQYSVVRLRGTAEFITF